MIKILILIAIVFLMTAMGALLAADKKKIMAVFAELYEFNEQLLINIKYSRKSVAAIARNFKYVPGILEGKQVLGGEYAEAVNDYITNVGKSDPLSQIDYLNEKKAVLLKLKTEGEQNYKKYSSLYIKIFFMAGVLLAIILA